MALKLTDDVVSDIPALKNLIVADEKYTIRSCQNTFSHLSAYI